MKRFHYGIIAVLFVVSGCSVFVKAPQKVQKGKRVVCILYDETEFKNKVVERVSNNLTSKKFTVVTDRLNRAKYYSSADFGAVVYMSEYWMWHTPRHAKRYFERNKESRNTLFVVTSGAPNIKIGKPFDAVTTASKPEQVTVKSKEITEKLGRILK